MVRTRGWLPLVLCSAAFVVLIFGFFLGRIFGGTVIYEKNSVVITPDASSQPEEPAAVTGQININTADAETLETLPGIGPTLAQRIVEYRQTYGPFRTTNQIKDVKGIGDSIFAEIADRITVGGDS